jgi:rhamnosyltransferase
MSADEVLAVIVSFNGHDKAVRTIEALLGRVGHVLVVDNASDDASTDLLRSLECRSDLSFVFLSENKGIGFALNIAVQRARERGYRWLLTMDQDSLADVDMVTAFRAAVVCNPGMACLTPTVVLGSARVPRGDDEEVSYAITSGNLVRLDVFDKAGLYDEDMFIDQIDFDFSLRVRKAGFTIHRVGKSVLRHELGDAAAPRGLLGVFHTFHSPLRRYYSYRNFLQLAKRHTRDFPGFVLKLGLVHILQLISIAIHGKERARSFTFIVRGVGDFVRGRGGPYNAPR